MMATDRSPGARAHVRASNWNHDAPGHWVVAAPARSANTTAAGACADLVKARLRVAAAGIERCRQNGHFERSHGSSFPGGLRRRRAFNDPGMTRTSRRWDPGMHCAGTLFTQILFVALPREPFTISDVPAPQSEAFPFRRTHKHTRGPTLTSPHKFERKGPGVSKTATSSSSASSRASPSWLPGPETRRRLESLVESPTGCHP